MRLFDNALYAPDERTQIARLIGFDAAFYRTAYPDVAEAGVDPLAHFLQQGVGEARLPTPLEVVGATAAPSRGLADILGFDPAFYAATYPDTGLDPLRHFLEAGMRERRLPFPLDANLAAEQTTWGVLDRRAIAHEYSLERQRSFAPGPWRGVAAELLAAARQRGVPSRPYRNNFWLAVAVGLLAEERFGAAACCYNFFFNYYVPMASLGNGEAGAIATCRVAGTSDALSPYAPLAAAASPTGAAPPAGAVRRVRRRAVAAAADVPEPCFLNRVGVATAPVAIALPVPVFGTLADVEMIAGSSLILLPGHRALYDYLDADSSDPPELQCPALVHAVGATCAVRWPADGLDVDEAFSLLHDHAHNYHHWLLEVLPRYLFALRRGLHPATPLLVDSRLAKQPREALHVAVGGEPPLILLPQRVAARIRRLHFASDLCHNSVRTERRAQKSDIVFSPDAVAMLRQLAAPFLVSGVGGHEHMLVLRRNVQFRRLINRDMLEEELRGLGFWGFDPGRATWVEQVRAFSNASLIVAEAGAALANIVFCRKGATVIVLVSGHPHSNFFFLAQLAGLVGAKLYFYECLRLDGSHAIGVQDDLIVPVGEFVDHVRRFARG